MSTAVAERAHTRYSEKEIERGLHTLALLNSAEKASQATGIPKRTLTYWRSEQHAARYQEIRSQVMPRIHAEVATESEDLARSYAQLERKAIEDIEEDWDNLKTQDKIAAGRNWTVSRGISIDKALLLRNRPTAIVEHRKPDELAIELKRMGIDVVDGTAEEEPSDDR